MVKTAHIASDNRDLLVVASRRERSLTDEYLKQWARDLIQAERPSRAQAFRTRTQALRRDAGGLINAVKDRPLAFLSGARPVEAPPSESDCDRREPAAKDQSLENNMTIVMNVLRAVYREDPGVAFPDLWTLRPDDRRLDTLTCLDGRFAPDVVYVAHPANRNAFVRLANFHAYMLQDKSSEFLKLAAALGASKITLVETLSQQKQGALGVGADAKTAVVDIGTGATAESVSNSSLNLLAAFYQPMKRPCLPEDLRWYHQEPLWQVMSDMRINNWAKDYEIVFSYKRSFNVTANLAAKVSGIGFDIGGEFSGFHEVEQRYHIDFFPPEAYNELR